jgi:hypothetical protein
VPASCSAVPFEIAEEEDNSVADVGVAVEIDPPATIAGRICLLAVQPNTIRYVEWV